MFDKNVLRIFFRTFYLTARTFFSIHPQKKPSIVSMSLMEGGGAHTCNCNLVLAGILSQSVVRNRNVFTGSVGTEINDI